MKFKLPFRRFHAPALGNLDSQCSFILLRIARPVRLLQCLRIQIARHINLHRRLRTVLRWNHLLAWIQHDGKCRRHCQRTLGNRARSIFISHHAHSGHPFRPGLADHAHRSYGRRREGKSLILRIVNGVERLGFRIVAVPIRPRGCGCRRNINFESGNDAVSLRFFRQDLGIPSLRKQ